MKGKAGKDAADERAERLAKALRENLHRRKSQARQRKQDDAAVQDDDETRSGD